MSRLSVNVTTTEPKVFEQVYELFSDVEAILKP
jgi:hypothetical protein